MTRAAESPFESLQEIALVNGDVYQVGWAAPGVPASRVERILRYKEKGTVQIDVRAGGTVCHNIYRGSDIAQAFGSDDPTVHFW